MKLSEVQHNHGHDSLIVVSTRRTYLPRKPPFCSFNHFHRGSASLPFTSILANMSNSTPKLLANSRISASLPGSFKVQKRQKNSKTRSQESLLFSTYLATKLVARKGQNREPFVLVLLVKFHELSIVGTCQASFRRDVNDQTHIPPGQKMKTLVTEYRNMKWKTKRTCTCSGKHPDR